MRKALTFHQAFAAASACFIVACSLDLGGLEAPEDASLPSTVTTVTSTLDGATSLAEDSSSPGFTSVPSSDAGFDGSGPPPDLADADAPDVVLGPDGSPPTAGDSCDLDQDGYRSTAAGCGGNDCCDNDARAHPGESSFFTSPDACGSFDYDCDGKDDAEFGKADCTLGVFTCNGSGFDGAAAPCGATAEFDTCDFFILCYVSQAQKEQACR